MTDPARLFLLSALSTAVGVGVTLFMVGGRSAHHAPPPAAPSRPDAPAITIWLTRQALTNGIQEYRTEDPGPVDHLTVALREDANTTHFIPYGPGEWHRTREAAVARAERMRAERIAELKREIEKLEAKEF
jgi:hypothetical protein